MGDGGSKEGVMERGKERVKEECSIPVATASLLYKVKGTVF